MDTIETIMQRLKNYEPLFDKYYIAEALALGEVSFVYKVVSKKGDSIAAIKVVPIDSNKMHEISKYEQAIETIIGLSQHDANHLIKMHSQTQEFRPDGGVDILALMDFYDQTLEDIIKTKESYPEDKIQQLGVAVCAALEVVHSKGILHQNIRPCNILISTQQNHIALAKFGVSKILQIAKEGQFELNVQHHTQRYDSPEALYGGLSCDIYSLGMVLYEAVNNWRIPFEPSDASEAQTKEALAKRAKHKILPPPLREGVPRISEGAPRISEGAPHISERASSISEGAPHLSERINYLKAVILDACAYEKSDRYISAAAMKQALETPPSSLMPTLMPSPVPDTHKNRGEEVLLYVAIASLALLIMALLLGVYAFVIVPRWF